MPVNWDFALYGAIWDVRIGWADTDDPQNQNGERINEHVTYSRDSARYAERGPIPYLFYFKRAKWLLDQLIARGLDPAHRVIFIGCGFNFYSYAFRHASALNNIPALSGYVDYPNTWGIDASNDIASEYDNQRIGDETFVDDDWTQNDKQRVINKLQNVTGGTTFHVVINLVTESYNPTTEVADLDLMFTACERALVGTDTRRIVHVVDNALPEGPLPEDPSYQTLIGHGFVIQTLAEWAAVKPTHTWLDGRTGETILGSVT